MTTFFQSSVSRHESSLQRDRLARFRFVYTAISRNVVGKKQKTAQANPERYFGIRSMNFNKSIDTLNPRCLAHTVTILDGEPWMKEFFGYSVDDVAATLFMSPRTVERYISKCLNTGEVKWEKLGRPLNSFAMHPHVEFVIMEAVLEHPDKTLAEIAYDVYEQTGSENVVSSILRYLKRNSFTRKKVCEILALL